MLVSVYAFIDVSLALVPICAIVSVSMSKKEDTFRGRIVGNTKVSS